MQSCILSTDPDIPPQVHLSSQRHTHEVPLLVCIHIKLHTQEHTLLLWCIYVHKCTYTFFTCVREMLKYPCMSSTLELKQGCIWRRYFCLRVQSVLNGAALRKYCHCLLILPSPDGRVSFGKSWESIRNSGRFWLPYFPRRKEVRVRAS